MAEDKRIRVSADASALQELRQGAQNLWDDLNKMEGRFKDLAEDTLNVLRQQIDLIKERNTLAGDSSFINPTSQQHGRENWFNRNIVRPLVGDHWAQRGNTTISQGMPNGKVFDDIYTVVLRIADTLESQQRNEQNGVLPETPPVQPPIPPTPPSPTNPENNKDDGGGKFSIPTSINGLLGKAGMAGMVAAAVGAIAGRVANALAGQYTSENEFQRANKRWGWIPFVGSAIEQVKEADRQAGQRFEAPGSQMARMLGTTYHNAARRAVIEAGGISAADTWEERTRQLNPYKEGGDYPVTEWVNKRTGEVSPVYPHLGDQAYVNNWYGKSLGMSMSEYTQRHTELAMAAGGRPMQSTPYRTEQLMLAEQIRGLDRSQTESVQQTVRFGSNQLTASGSAYAVIRTFDTTLQNMGKTNAEIVGTLHEYLGQFNRASTQILERTATVNTAAVTRAIASLRQRGFDGRQLERVSNSLMGNNISQDDTTQALLLRTAREIKPNGSLSDLLADIDEIGNGSPLAAEFFDKLREMTGGGEMFRHVLKAVYPELTYSDIRTLTSGNNENATGKQLLEGVNMTLSGYSRERAAQITGTQEKDTATEATRKEIEGLRQVENAVGNPLHNEDKDIKPVGERPTPYSQTMLGFAENQVNLLQQILKELREGVVVPYRI